MGADGLRATRLVLWREYIQRVRSRSFVLTTLLTPLFLFAMSVLPALLAAPHLLAGRNLTLVSDDPALAASVRAALGGNHRVARFSIAVDPDTAPSERERLAAMVRARRIDGFIWLDQHAIASGRVEYISRGDTDFLERELLQSALGPAITRERLTRHGLAAAEIQRALEPIELVEQSLARGGGAAAADMSGYFVGLFLVFFLEMSLLSYGLMVMRSVLDDKTSRVMEVLLCAATPRDLMAGKILGVGMVNLTQVAIWGLMGLLVVGPGVAFAHLAVPVHLSLGQTVLFAIFYVLGYLLYSSIYAAVGAAFNSVDEAQNWNFLITLPLLISGVMAFSLAEHPADTLAVAFSLLPPFAPAIMSMRIAAGAAPPWQVAAALVLLAVSIYLAVALSSRVYRVGILMYGKRPSLGEIARWLSYA